MMTSATVQLKLQVSGEREQDYILQTNSTNQKNREKNFVIICQSRQTILVHTDNPYENTYLNSFIHFSNFAILENYFAYEMNSRPSAISSTSSSASSLVLLISTFVTFHTIHIEKLSNSFRHLLLDAVHCLICHSQTFNFQCNAIQLEFRFANTEKWWEPAFYTAHCFTYIVPT